MKRNNKNGFTLVELLAVIVILAIILVIAVPKVMSVIEDSKKATLESTAKMIASAAEKQKVQNTVLGNSDAITCDSVAKINKGDYASCSIEFDNNTAKVTIEGSGKFEGLWVCGGTKTEAIATSEECKGPAITLVAHIQELLKQEETLNNGLVQTNAEYNGTTYDAGIRYVGAMDEVKNKVYYNCEDTDASGVSYGADNYDYASSCEVWRIIGVFNTKTNTSSDEVPRVKIINTASTFKAAWDSSEANGVAGINQWGESIYEDGTLYKGADLMQLLNGYYRGQQNSICVYYDYEDYEILEFNCDNESLRNANMKELTTTGKSMIENAVWNTYAVKVIEEGLPDLSFASTAYLEEKGIIAQNDGKNLCVDVNGTDYYYCDDNIERTTSWTGLVGLMSVSDAIYADGWLYNQNELKNNAWSITPGAYSGDSTGVWSNYGVSVSSTFAGDAQGVFPSVYLKEGVKVISGNGDDKPYILGL